MTSSDNDNRYTLRQKIHGAKGLELLHAVGRSGIKSVMHGTGEHEIMLMLEADGYVKKVLGDWMLTSTGVGVWQKLFDPGHKETRNLFEMPHPD